MPFPKDIEQFHYPCNDLWPDAIASQGRESHPCSRSCLCSQVFQFPTCEHWAKKE